MREFWDLVRLAIAALGGWLGWFVGGLDGLVIALVLFMAVDYVTGVLCAVQDKRLNSSTGFRGLAKKVVILMLVGVANILDVQIVHQGAVIRTAVIFFYLANEGISLLENAAHLGLPIPEKLRAVLEQLHDRADKEGEL